MTTTTEFLTELHPLLSDIEQAINNHKVLEHEYEQARIKLRELERDLEKAQLTVIEYHEVLNLCLEKGIDPVHAKLIRSTELSHPSSRSVHRSHFGIPMPTPHAYEECVSRKVKFGILPRLLRLIKSQ